MTRLPVALLRAVLRAFADRRLWGLVVVAWVGLGVAYQINAPYVLDVGGADDCPYFGVAIYCRDGTKGSTPHWGDPERDGVTGTTFRWTRGQSEIVLPGLGSAPWAVTLRLAGGRPAAAPTVPLTVTINGQPFAWQVEPGYGERTFVAQRAGLTGGDLTVVLQSPTFRPANDRRDLGVAVDWLRVAPPAGEFVPVIPPLGLMGAVLAALLLVYGLVYSVARGAGAALVVTGGVLGVFLVLLVTRRPELGLFAPSLVWVLVGGLGLAWGVIGWGAWRARRGGVARS